MSFKSPYNFFSAGQGPLTEWLKRTPRFVFLLYTSLLAFATYFCTYAFRKPYQAVTYEGLSLWGMDLKTSLVVSQLIGYALSKWLGVKLCSEVKPNQRMISLIGLVVFSELMLVCFGVLPCPLKMVSIFFNGLALGMIWGLIVLYLEGRRLTETLFAGLSCSYIISSGVVKDVGRWVISSFGVDQFRMPAVTGLLFLPFFLVVVWLLNQIPEPTAEDMSERVKRRPMNSNERKSFFKAFWVGICLQLVVYVFLMAFRDYRDSYSVDIIQNLGLQDKAGIFSRMEIWVAFAAMISLVVMNFFKPKRYGVTINIVIMLVGFILIGTSTFMLDKGVIDGFTWMVLAGIGGYLGFIPSDTVFYDRLISSTGSVGTAVFMAYVMDASGYTGSIVLQLTKESLAGQTTRLDFFRGYCYLLTWLGLAILLFNLVYFHCRTKNIRNKTKSELPEK